MSKYTQSTQGARALYRARFQGMPERRQLTPHEKAVYFEALDSYRRGEISLKAAEEYIRLQFGKEVR